MRMTTAGKVFVGVGSLFAVGMFTLAGSAAMKIWDWIPASRALPEAEAKAKALGLPLLARDIQPQPPVSAADNAAPSLRALSEEYQRSKGLKDLENAIRDEKWEDAARAVAGYGKLTELAYQAAEKPGLDFGRDWDLGPNVLFPEYANMKGAVKILCYRARIRAKQGNVEGALADLRVARKLADLCGREPTIISLLVQIAGRRIVSKSVELMAADWHAQPRNLEQLSILMHEPARRYDFQNAMKGEVFMGVATIRNFDAFGGMRMLGAFSGTSSEPLPRLDPKNLQREGMPSGLKAKAFMTRQLEYWSDLWPAIQSAGDDPRLVGKLMDAKSQALEQRREASYTLGKIMFPVFAQSGDAVVRAYATDAATMVYVDALHAHAKSGKWPLKTTVDDPFTKQPLKVKAYGQTFRVYSVGPDGQDDGGVSRTELTNKDDNPPYDEVAAFPPIKSSGER